MVYLRAGWSLGNVPDRYIVGGAGGDFLVGRFISLLPPNNPSFATLPPHFTNEGLTVLQDIGLKRMVPGFDHLPSSFQRVVPYLLASLLYHEDWLRRTYKENHPLWKTSFFTLNMQARARLKPHVVTGVYKHPITQMQATGIPGYITQCQELAEIRKVLEDQNKELLSLYKEQNRVIIKMLDEQPEKLREYLVKHLDGLGPRAATKDDIAAAISEMKSYIDLRVQAPTIAAGVPSASSATATSRSVIDENVAKDIWDSDGSVKQMQHFWDGQFRYCCQHSCTSPIHRISEVSPPHDFHFKNMPLKQCFALWYLGNELTCTGPYRKIAKHHHEPIK